MNLEEEMRKLKERGPDRPIALSKMAKILAASLDKAAIGWAGKVFWNRKFRRLALFDSLNQEERNRIFNELILAPLALFMIMLEAPDLRLPKEMRDYLLLVKDEIPKAHLDGLKQLGIERRFRRDWDKLINMRYEEYSEDKHSSRSAMMEYESQGKPLSSLDLDKIQLFLPVFTVAVGCHTHICRGKTKGRDLLYKLIVKELSRFYTQIRIRLEGGDPGLILKTRMSLRHFWNDLKENWG